MDLNHADHAQLLQLPGVGETLARRIEAYRDGHRGFRDVDELRRVGGIGPATLERLRPFVYAESLPAAEDDDPAGVSEPEPSTRVPSVPARSSQEKTVVGKKAETLVEKIDLNRASAEELQRLPGIGPALSARIVAARNEKPFASVEDLRRVRGIGPKTLERLRPHVTVAGGAAKEG